MALKGITGWLIHAYCEQPSVISEHLEKKAGSLQQDIDDNHISLSNINLLEGWMNKEELTEIVVYQGNTVLYDSNRTLPNLS